MIPQKKIRAIVFRLVVLILMWRLSLCSMYVGKWILRKSTLFWCFLTNFNIFSGWISNVLSVPDDRKIFSLIMYNDRKNAKKKDSIFLFLVFVDKFEAFCFRPSNVTQQISCSSIYQWTRISTILFQSVLFEKICKKWKNDWECSHLCQFRFFDVRVRQDFSHRLQCSASSQGFRFCRWIRWVWIVV